MASKAGVASGDEAVVASGSTSVPRRQHTGSDNSGSRQDEEPWNEEHRGGPKRRRRRTTEQ
jgi:hypothetical protein